jgi:hypothetical protein
MICPDCGGEVVGTICIMCGFDLYEAECAADFYDDYIDELTKGPKIEPCPACQQSQQACERTCGREQCPHVLAK